MRIESDELTDPLGTFDFEVHSHVHWIYIGLTIAIGLICSFFLKVSLQQQIELDQARLDAHKLLERIAAEELLHTDPVFANAYAARRTELNTRLTGTTPTDINTAKAELDATWRNALQDLTKRRQNELDALDKLRDITNIDWLVPTAIRDAVLAARTAVAEVVPLIERDDLTQADTQRRQVVTNLGDAIRETALAWQIAEETILNLLQGNPNGISAAVSTALGKPAQDLSASLKKISTNTAVGTPEQIQQVLSDIKIERLSVRQFVDWLEQAIRTETSTAQSVTKAANLTNWNAAIFAVLQNAVDAFIEFLESTVDTPNAAAVRTRLDAVHQAWTDTLKKFPSFNANVQTNLAARSYIGAVRAALQQNAVALGGPTAQVFTAPAFPGYTGGTPAPVYSVRTRFQTLFTAVPTLPTSVTADAQLKKDKGRQSLIVGLIIIVAGYGLELNTFVGTFTDFSTLFFWAFGLDLTLDAIRGATRKSG